MFGNAEALAGLHQSLLSELKERMAKFDDNACIADVICRLVRTHTTNAHILHTHTYYCTYAHLPKHMSHTHTYLRTHAYTS